MHPLLSVLQRVLRDLVMLETVTGEKLGLYSKHQQSVSHFHIMFTFLLCLTQEAGIWQPSRAEDLDHSVSISILAVWMALATLLSSII